MLDREMLAVHYHAHLDVIVRGVHVTVPAFIGIGLVAASAALFHNEIESQSRRQVVGTALLAASLLLPILDTIIFRSVLILHREQVATAKHSFSELMPGVRVPISTLAGAALFRRLLDQFPREAAGYTRDAGEIEWRVKASF